MTMTPDCMDDWELALWREQAEFLRRSWSKSNVTDPCSDCTAMFSAEMRAIGRCNGVPGLHPGRPQFSLSERRRASNRMAARRWRARNPGYRPRKQEALADERGDIAS